MRPLNRPMFKYGGPIKEGIMTGMQDRQGYQDAGRVAQYFTNLGKKSLNLLNPLKKIPGGKQLMQSGFVKGLLTSPGKTGPFDKGIPFTTRFRNLLPAGNFRNVAVPSGQRITGKYQPAPLRFSEVIRSPEAVGRFVRENPIATYLGLGQIKNLPEIAGGAVDIGTGAVQTGVNYLLIKDKMILK